MSADAPDAPARAPLVLAALVLAAVVCNINVASATVALPEVGDAFGASQTLLNLVGVGTGLGLSISVLYLGALADRYGRKQLLILGLVLTVAASVIAAAAPSVEVLIAARVFTGIAAGMAYPTTLSLITALWSPGPGRTAAIALWASVSGVASVTGSVIAGLVLEVAWWGAAFLLAVPVAIAGLVLVIAVVPSHVNESSEPVDHAGGILSALGIGSLVLGANLALAPGEQALGVLLLAASALLLVGFVWRQSRAPHPLFDLSVARQRLFWVPALSGAIAVGGLIGAIFVGEQFMQNVLGYDPMQAGFAVVPAAAGLLLMAPVSARLVDARGTRATMLVGYACVLAAFVTMLAWREGTSYALVGAGFLALGAGAALVMTASSRSLTGITPVTRVGMASATSDLQSDLGGSLMSSVLGAILAAGFSRSFAAAIESSSDAASIGDEVTRALQASYASALHVAEQYPQFKDEIIEAARASLQAGAIGAYAVGSAAIVIGAVLVVLVLPSHDDELALVTTTR